MEVSGKGVGREWKSVGSKWEGGGRKWKYAGTERLDLLPSTLYKWNIMAIPDKPIIELDILSAGFYSVRFIRFMSGVNAFIDLLTG